MSRIVRFLFGCSAALLSLQPICYAASASDRLGASTPIPANSIATRLAQNTACTNGKCVSCNGALSCSNGHCICNGEPVATAPNVSNGAFPNGACGNQPVVAHPNGGGSVATSAFADPTAYVSADSAVCGNAMVRGPARLTGSILNDSSRVFGRSVVDGSIVNGGATVSNSSIVRSTLNSSAQITNSTVENSLINGSGSADRSRITNSILNGNLSLVGRMIDGSIIN